MTRVYIPSATSKMIVAGSMSDVVDVSIQNLSANNIYVSYSPIGNVNDGIKIPAGESYTNAELCTTLYAIADVDNSEARVETQASWVMSLAHVVRYGRV